MPFEALVKHLKEHPTLTILGAEASEVRDDHEAHLTIQLNVSTASRTQINELHDKLRAIVGSEKKLKVLGFADNLTNPKDGEARIVVKSPVSQLGALRFKALQLVQ